jgi:CheY-like chemotaxis protein
LEDLPVIIIIEDDQSIQSIVEDALSEGGFEFAVAASGEEAVTLLKGQKTKYRALVTDVSLKGRMDGWEVAMRARNRSAISHRLHEWCQRQRLACQRRQHHAYQAIRASPTCHRPLQPSQHGRSADCVDLVYSVFGDRKETARAGDGLRP